MVPAISFIVPAYNEERELPATLSAIRAAAHEAAVAYEIVVVDDDSNDNSATIARRFAARVISIRRRHIAAARNAGADTALGDILIFVDADTHIRAEHVRGVLEALAEGYAGGGARLCVDHSIPIWGKLLFAAFTTIYFGLNLGAGAFLFTTRKNFEEIGGFDETYFASEEVFFTIALKRVGRFKVLPVPVMTSGRKLRIYSARKIFVRGASILLGGRHAVMSRRKLDLWYDGRREEGVH